MSAGSREVDAVLAMAVQYAVHCNRSHHFPLATGGIRRHPAVHLWSGKAVPKSVPKTTHNTVRKNQLLTRVPCARALAAASFRPGPSLGCTVMTGNAQQQSQSGSFAPRIVVRPEGPFQALDAKERWELTRRHPYYLILWESAAAPDGSDDLRLAMQHAARAILRAIGVGIVYPSPGTSWEEINQGELAAYWLKGAISRVTVRNVVAILLRFLQPNDKLRIADMLTRSANATDPKEILGLANEVCQGDLPDRMLPEIVVTINPNASQTAIKEAVETAVRDIKAEHQIPERRRRGDKLEEYLSVWDRREGWTGTEYGNPHEHQLNVVARDLGITTSTAMNRYRSAFENIVGHEYSPDLWAATMGLVKLSRFTAGDTAILSRRRPLNPRTRRDVPESTLTATRPNTEHWLPAAGVMAVDGDAILLAEDVKELIRLGRQNSQIIAELELNPAHADHLIEFLRDRVSDGL